MFGDTLLAKDSAPDHIDNPASRFHGDAPRRGGHAEHDRGEVLRCPVVAFHTSRTVFRRWVSRFFGWNLGRFFNRYVRRYSGWFLGRLLRWNVGRELCR